jgi:hypothetical protein
VTLIKQRAAIMSKVFLNEQELDQKIHFFLTRKNIELTARESKQPKRTVLFDRNKNTALFA